MATIDSMFELAIDLRNKGELRDSIHVLLKVLTEYPIDKKAYGIYSVLGGVHSDLGENDQALIYFKNATELNLNQNLLPWDYM